MTWTKLGAEWPDEAKGLSHAAYRLHVDALCYSNRSLNDLELPKRELDRCSWVDEPQAAAAELVAAGFWEDRGDAYYIGGRWPSWQRSRAQVLAKRKTDEQAQRRKRKHDAGDHSECLRSCPHRPSAHDNAHESAHESARRSERNGTAAVTDGVSKSAPDDDDGWPPVVLAESREAARATTRAPTARPLPNGRCHECEAKITTGGLYCLACSAVRAARLRGGPAS